MNEESGQIEQIADAAEAAGASPVAGLNPRQEAALVALLNEPTVARAAKAAGVGERTLHTWLDQPVFSNAYRQARRQIFEQAVSLTQRYSSLAVQTLATAMTNPGTPWTCKVTAAIGLLRFAREGIELEDLQERVAALEAAEGIVKPLGAGIAAALRANAEGRAA